MKVVRDKQLSKHFRAKEFACRCRRADCDANPVDDRFLALLESLREAWGQPLHPTSGQRCATWNQAVGGAQKSQHVEGKAVDFWFESPVQLKRFTELAQKIGFTGIGKGRHLVHLDTRDGPFTTWVYKDK